MPAEPRSFGLAEGVLRYAANPSLDSLVPDSLAARVAAAADSIGAGTLSVLGAGATAR